MPAIFHHSLTVNQAEIDIHGHVNNLRYVQWMQDAAVAHSAAQGWSAKRYQATGTAWVVRSHKIEYLQPAFLQDKVVVKTWVANLRKIQSLRKYKIMRADDDTVLAIAETNWAFLKLETRTPMRIPAELIESFEIVGISEEP